ncbi:MAG: hypothetical protein U1E36_07370 [Rickettsiales bacterium]
MEQPIHMLGALDQALVREEEKFLRERMGIQITGLLPNSTHVALKLPAFIQDKDEAHNFMQSFLPEAQHRHASHPREQRVIMPLYDVKDTTLRLINPISRRAVPFASETELEALDEEYRILLGKKERPRTSEEELSTKSFKQAIKALKSDSTLDFVGYYRDGRLKLPVNDERSAIYQVAEAMLRHGAVSVDDMLLERGDNGTMLSITPKALFKMQEFAVKGMERGGQPAIAGICASERRQARAEIFRERRLNHTRNSMHEALSLSESSKTAPYPYDSDKMLTALDYGFKMLDEPWYWESLDHAQLASQRNDIQNELKKDLQDVAALLKDGKLAQSQLHWLVNESPYRNAIRTIGHLLTVIQDKPAKSGSVQIHDSGATAWQDAFGLTKAAMLPKDTNAQEASYHLRSQTGQVGVGEVIKNNAFMGLRPIWHSLELAVTKPAMVGVAVGGIAAYSAMVPRRYSIPVMLNKLVEGTLAKLGIQHSHGPRDVFGFDKALKSGRDLKWWQKSGFVAGVTSASAVWIIFSVVEDVIVHLPLALVSVGVGAAGGATGRKVVAPVVEDLGDLAGRYAPQPVRDAYAADIYIAKKWYRASPFEKIEHGVKNAVRDVEEMGVIATADHYTRKLASQAQSTWSEVWGISAPPLKSR